MTKNNTMNIIEITKTDPRKGFFFVEDDVIARSSVRDSLQYKSKSARFPDFINKILEKY
jgi:hypothetical protein